MTGMLKCGARGSRLSVVQAKGAIAFIASEVEGFRARLVTFETPGDRDLSTPIESSAPDFFTRDLDDAVRGGAIDFAVHSAKDLPERIADDLDWFWLPNREDPRDCWVVRGRSAPRRIGVSSARRAEYARQVYPKAELLPIRGAVDSRLRQLAEGKFDAVLMAMAGLKRLGVDGGRDGARPSRGIDGARPSRGIGDGLEVVPISVDDLPPPEGQGYLAVTFRKGDVQLMEVRRHFAKAVRFTSAGVGDAGMITVRGERDLAEADVVLADCCGLSVASRQLRAGELGLRPPAPGVSARWVDVGKRCGRHSMEQGEITRMICDEARKGRRVVRLKGGDAGLFGRLAEETEALDSLGMPYLVRPGVSALSAATAPNGILLTKRGEARGFCVSTPRSEGAKEPHVFFMASRLAGEVLKGFPPDERYAMVWDAGGAYERIDTGVCGKPRIRASGSPGLLVVGYAGALRPAKRVLLTCSAAVMPRATRFFEDMGWRAVEWPMIELRMRDAARGALLGLESRHDAIVLTSPSAARMFLDAFAGDRRSLPKLWTCGAGTDAELRRYGVRSDIMPESDFSAKGLVARLKLEGAKVAGLRVLRLRSAKAGRMVAAALRRIGAHVEDVVLYDNVPVRREAEMPPCDAVFFASASGAEAFLSQYGAKALARKALYVMGEPTRSALPAAFRKKARKVGALEKY